MRFTFSSGPANYILYSIYTLVVSLERHLEMSYKLWSFRFQIPQMHIPSTYILVWSRGSSRSPFIYQETRKLVPNSISSFKEEADALQNYNASINRSDSDPLCKNFFPQTLDYHELYERKHHHLIHIKVIFQG